MMVGSRSENHKTTAYSCSMIVNHVGLCVSDLQPSLRFYEGLGFEHDTTRDLQPPDAVTGQLLGIEPPVGLTAVYLRRDEFTLELLHYRRPDNPAPGARPMNQPGLTHLSFTVGDLDATIEQVRALGGEVVESSNIGPAVMVRDPDGQLLELLRKR